ncbi:exodeoxyribonuclease III [Deinococcus metallilatus]|uniref:Exodeoxyribonuclease III n=1 Tax=Deinococcus metallilatus TaxID=1211322 RepID=A0AAJ5F412_9DEIO|nr:exodeoxyribonuclease III [Deinococcus metallilatus]MBB5295400.1 exodeoxyribonuclease-3 [Deinococcus metallilatus]QBY08070.1 exodeoxyribonuclease III [Deinococcus metallilatus]RXJ12963.1 exodeoxyribonuclease III [Deinococcus metallilatus]TLK27115.1 exodeoxyribonuclease III [Deinococcus metallilatus]
MAGLPPMPHPAPSALKVTTLNVNGLRSALRKGLTDWVARERPDVLLLQEVRADPMPEALADLGYAGAWFPAQKAGYSGVALLSLHPLSDVRAGMAHPDMDAEGRVLSAVVRGVRFASVYLPSGSSGPERQGFKDRVLGDYHAWTEATLAGGLPLVIGGDYNVAHREPDLKNWRGNQKNSGFLPHEREWMTAHLACGLSDTHRAHLGERSEYTWWSNRGNAYANDVGWRIDYLLAAGVPVRELWVDRHARLSDHAPLTGTVDLGG